MIPIVDYIYTPPVVYSANRVKAATGRVDITWDNEPIVDRDTGDEQPEKARRGSSVPAPIHGFAANASTL